MSFAEVYWSGVIVLWVILFLAAGIVSSFVDRTRRRDDALGLIGVAIIAVLVWPGLVPIGILWGIGYLIGRLVRKRPDAG